MVTKLTGFREAQAWLIRRAVERFGSLAGVASFLDVEPANFCRYSSLKRELPEHHWKSLLEAISENELLKKRAY